MWIMARREDGCRAGLPMTRHTATSSRTSRVVCVWTRYDNTDSNFFYDYLALLGTMQPGSLGTNSSVSDGVLSLSNSSCHHSQLRNQHFFSTKQTEKMLGWIKEAAKDWQKFTTWRATYRDATFALENFEAAINLEKFKRSYSKNKHYVSYLVDVCNLLLRSVISLWLRCVVSLVTLLQLTACGLVLADFILWTCPKFSFSFAEMALLNEWLNGPTDVRWLTPAACWRQLLLPVQSLWRHRKWKNFHQQPSFLDRLKTNSWPQNTWRRVECAEYLRVWSNGVIQKWRLDRLDYFSLQFWSLGSLDTKPIAREVHFQGKEEVRKWIKARREWREWKTPSMNSFQAENEQLRKKLAKLEVATLGPLASPPRVFRGFLCALFSHVLARFPLFLNYFSSSFALFAPLFVFSLWRILFTFLFTGIRFAQGAVQAIRAIETDRAVFASTERETSKPWTKGLPKDYSKD